MNPRTALVMDRHRELKAQGLSGLDASRVVLQEAQAGTLGVKQTVKPLAVKQAVLNTCECGNEIKGRGKKCSACYQKAYRERK